MITPRQKRARTLNWVAFILKGMVCQVEMIEKSLPGSVNPDILGRVRHLTRELRTIVARFQTLIGEQIEQGKEETRVATGRK